MPAPFETSFAAALLDADQPVPDGIRVHRSAVAARRFAVYRNNVAVSLGKVLEGRFPVVRKIVGGEFFAAMARVFVKQQPPRSPVMASYGDAFPVFIAGFEPADGVPYLADVARLEVARAHAYHAADATPLGAEHFAALDGHAVEALRIEMHPSTKIVRSVHPIITIWAMNSGEADLAPIDRWRGEDALVSRPYGDVDVRALPPGGAEFLRTLASGWPLGEAAAAARAETANFDLTGNLAGLIGSGLVQRIIVPEPRL